MTENEVLLIEYIERAIDYMNGRWRDSNVEPVIIIQGLRDKMEVCIKEWENRNVISEDGVEHPDHCLCDKCVCSCHGLRNELCPNKK